MKGEELVKEKDILIQMQKDELHCPNEVPEEEKYLELFYKAKVTGGTTIKKGGGQCCMECAFRAS